MLELRVVKRTGEVHNARGENQEELDNLIGEWTKTRPVAEVMKLTEEHAIPSGPVNSAKDIYEDAHARARNAIIKVLDPTLGEVPMQGIFPVLSDTPGEVKSTGPSLGQHTDEIFTELGLPVDEIASLRESGII